MGRPYSFTKAKYLTLLFFCPTERTNAMDLCLEQCTNKGITLMQYVYGFWQVYWEIGEIDNEATGNSVDN
jgi:hypothetical protein